MATNLVQDGSRIRRTLIAAAVSGRLYALEGGSETGANGMPCVAATDGAIGDSIDFIVEGVFTLTKINEVGAAVNQGDIVYWRNVAGVLQVTGLATSAGGVAGTAWAPASNTDTTMIVKLLGAGGKAATP